MEDTKNSAVKVLHTSMQGTLMHRTLMQGTSPSEHSWVLCALCMACLHQAPLCILKPIRVIVWCQQCGNAIWSFGAMPVHLYKTWHIQCISHVCDVQHTLWTYKYIVQHACVCMCWSLTLPAHQFKTIQPITLLMSIPHLHNYAPLFKYLTFCIHHFWTCCCTNNQHKCDRSSIQ